MERRVLAVLLAGGASSRFGSNKALALWRGRPFLSCVAEAVRPVSDALLVLAPAGRPDLEYAKLAPGAMIVPDRTPSAGPVEALRGAEALLRAPLVLVAPCDAPGLPSGLARHLVARCEETRRVAVAETADGPLHTLFAAPRSLLVERLPKAERMEDLTRDATLVPTEADGLNVNEPPVA